MAGKTRGTPGCAAKRAGRAVKPLGVKAVRQETEVEAAETPLRPAQCRAYMRRELAREFRGIVRGFVKGAKTGSCQHVKLATALLGTPARTRNRGQQTIERLIREMEKLEDAPSVEMGGAASRDGRVQ